MSDMTVSEVLFEQFCQDNSIPYSRVEQGEFKTPDYDVDFGGHRVIVEVKQINPNEDDERLRDQVRSRGAAAGWDESGRRVRLKISSAKKQLKAGSQGQYSTILVLYDNVPVGSLDADDIKTAMYGPETIKLLVPDDPEDERVKIENVGLGSERKFTPTQNTTFSAIALLFEFGGALRFSIFHNLHAKHPITPSWLRRDTVRHFELGPQVQGTFPEWREV
jgi:hypothetical protein